jgi:hypothetical protein
MLITIPDTLKRSPKLVFAPLVIDVAGSEIATALFAVGTPEVARTVEFQAGWLLQVTVD